MGLFPSMHALWAIQCTHNLLIMYVVLFSDMVEDAMEVFIDDFSMVGDLF